MTMCTKKICILGAAMLLSLVAPLRGAPPTMTFGRVGEFTFQIVVTSDVSTHGGEAAIAYDESVVSLDSIVPGPDFPGTTDDIFVDLEPADACPLDGDATRGFMVG